LVFDDTGISPDQVQPGRHSMSERIASAVFDSREEAERALSELRQAGIDEDSISILGRSEASGEGREGFGEGEDEETKDDVTKGAAIGTGAGALLGVAALAIPGVGPLAAAGAIAGSAIPTAAVIGGGAGLAAGSVTGLLSEHGVSDEDASYYEERLHKGGIVLAVHGDEAGGSLETARDILFRNGGHSASRARTEAI
jgi:hypothetical protein